MNLVEILKSKFELFKVGKEVFFYENDTNKILNLINDRELSLKTTCRYWYDKTYLYLICNREIIVYNTDFHVVENVFDEKITTEGTWIVYFENKDYFISNQSFDRVERKLIGQSKIRFEGISFQQANFYGKILNQNYRLNYQENVFNSPRYFRCSDLLDKTTYWEYDCGEGYTAGRFYLWKDYLVFVKGNHENASLVLIDLPTGRVVWENQIMYGEFNLDTNQGILVSVWGNKYVGNNYQIIDLNKRSIEVGRFQSPIMLENVAVNWQLQYLYENKLYFVDNVHSTYGEEPRPIRFGCFDTVSKQLDFIQEVPEAAGGQFAQVLYHDNRLYLRTSANELFIFEE